MDEGDEAVEDIFEDGLLTIFGDVTVFHGDPGNVFRYRSSNGYCVQRLNANFQFSTIAVHLANTESFDERGECSPCFEEPIHLIL